MQVASRTAHTPAAPTCAFVGIAFARPMHLPHPPAPAAPPAISPSVWSRRARRRPPQASLQSALASLPYGTIIAAGVSVGILGATFENMLNVLYKGRRRQPSDDELCHYCAGFGNVRCEVCSSRGVISFRGTDATRQCPACQGRKWERCRRCAGTGKSGMKKSQVKSPR